MSQSFFLISFFFFFIPLSSKNHRKRERKKTEKKKRKKEKKRKKKKRREKSTVATHCNEAFLVLLGFSFFLRFSFGFFVLFCLFCFFFNPRPADNPRVAIPVSAFCFFFFLLIFFFVAQFLFRRFSSFWSKSEGFPGFFFVFGFRFFFLQKFPVPDERNTKTKKTATEKEIEKERKKERKKERQTETDRQAEDYRKKQNKRTTSVRGGGLSCLTFRRRRPIVHSDRTGSDNRNVFPPLISLLSTHTVHCRSINNNKPTNQPTNRPTDQPTNPLPTPHYHRLRGKPPKWFYWVFFFFISSPSASSTRFRVRSDTAGFFFFFRCFCCCCCRPVFGSRR